MHNVAMNPWLSVCARTHTHVRKCIIINSLCYRLSNGGEYLFQARDDREMSEWVEAINASSGGEGASSSSRAQTLPAEGASAKGEKKGFFTLGKGSKK